MKRPDNAIFFQFFEFIDASHINAVGLIPTFMHVDVACLSQLFQDCPRELFVRLTEFGSKPLYRHVSPSRTVASVVER